MKYICPRCKNPASDHAPFRSFCPLKESEVLALIIDLQGKAIKEYGEDHHRIEMLNLYLRKNEWADFGFNCAGVYTDEHNGSLTETSDEYYIDGDHYAPTLREAFDLWLKHQLNKEDDTWPVTK